MVHYARGTPLANVAERLAAAEAQLASSELLARLRGIEMLAALGHCGIERLSQIVEAGDSTVLPAALTALAECEELAAAALPAIRHVADDDVHPPHVRTAALLAIVQIDEAHRASALRRLLLEAQSLRSVSKEQAFQRLAALTPRQIDMCAELLNDDDMVVRYGALRMLVEYSHVLREQTFAERDWPRVREIQAAGKTAAQHADPVIRRAAQHLFDAGQPPPRRGGCTSIVPIVG